MDKPPTEISSSECVQKIIVDLYAALAKAWKTDRIGPWGFGLLHLYPIAGMGYVHLDGQHRTNWEWEDFDFDHAGWVVFGGWDESYCGEWGVVIDGKEVVDGDAAIELAFMEAIHEELSRALNSADFAVDVNSWGLSVGHSASMELVAPKP